jgi:hypothetical protein
MKRRLHCTRVYVRAKPRSGTVLVFTVFLMICLFAMLAFSVDLGYLALVRTQAQRTADAAALAGAASLYEPIANLENYAYYLPPDAAKARTETRRFVQHNLTAGRKVDVDPADVVVGRLYNVADRTESVDLFFPTQIPWRSASV